MRGRKGKGREGKGREGKGEGWGNVGCRSEKTFFFVVLTSSPFFYPQFVIGTTMTT